MRKLDKARKEYHKALRDLKVTQELAKQYAAAATRAAEKYRNLQSVERIRALVNSYVLIAQAINDAMPGFITTAEDPGPLSASRRAHKKTAEYIAGALAKDNPRFDRERFLAACGVTK